MYSYDITVALANDRRSKLQADAAKIPRSPRGPTGPQGGPPCRGAVGSPTCCAAPSGPRLRRHLVWRLAAPIDRAASLRRRDRRSARRWSQPHRHPPRATLSRNLASGTYRATVVDPDELLRFRSGDPEAVRAVYREYGSSVFAVAYKALGSQGPRRGGHPTDLREGLARGRDLRPRPGNLLRGWQPSPGARRSTSTRARRAGHGAARRGIAHRPPGGCGPELRRVGRAGRDRRVAAARTRGGAAPAPRVVDAGGDRRAARCAGRHDQVAVVPRPHRLLAARLGHLRERTTPDPRTTGRPSAYTWAEVTR